MCVELLMERAGRVAPLRSESVLARPSRDIFATTAAPTVGTVLWRPSRRAIVRGAVCSHLGLLLPVGAPCGCSQTAAVVSDAPHLRGHQADAPKYRAIAHTAAVGVPVHQRSAAQHRHRLFVFRYGFRSLVLVGLVMYDLAHVPAAGAM